MPVAQKETHKTTEETHKQEALSTFSQKRKSMKRRSISYIIRDISIDVTATHQATAIQQAKVLNSGNVSIETKLDPQTT